MKTISDLISKIKIPISPENQLFLLCERIVKENVKEKRNIKISINHKTAFIKTDSYTKQLLIIRKDEILKKFKEIYPNTSLKEIR